MLASTSNVSPFSSTDSLPSLSTENSSSSFSSSSSFTSTSSMSTNTAVQQQSSSSSEESRKWRALTARLGKTLLAFGFYLGNLLLNVVLLAIVHERTPIDELPLPDVTFDLLPYWPGAIYLVEAYIIVLLLLVFLLSLFHRNGYRIGQRFCLVSGMVYFVRAVSIAVTQLPVSGNRHDCQPKQDNVVSIWLFIETIIWRCLVYLPTLGLRLASRDTFCGDNLFAGYLVTVVLSYCFLSYYLMPAEVKATSLWWWAADGLLYFASLLAVLLMLVGRSHYLVDIIFGYYVSTRVFYIYHTICNHESLHYSTAGNFFTKFWWWPLFVFFEVDNPGQVVATNRFHNPFSAVGKVLGNRRWASSNSKACKVRRGQKDAPNDKFTLTGVSH